MGTRLVVIGGVAAGTKAAATARRRNSAASIIVLQDEADVSYSSCGLPYHLADMEGIPRAKLIARTPEVFRSDGIDMRTRHRVEEIDAERGLVIVRDLQQARSYSEPYDKLLIATGAQASPLKASVGAGAPPVVHLRSIADADHIAKRLTGVRKVIILGGGYIGLEMAHAFKALGRDVTLIEAMPHVTPSYDEAIAQTVEATLRRHGVELFTGARVIELAGGGVVLETGNRIPADLVLVATGVRPATALALSAGIKLGDTDAIAVSPQMTTNLGNVYAAGDCAESRHRVTGRPVWLPLGDVANRHGRVAGVNMAGGHAEFAGVLGTGIFQVFDLAVARTGLGHEQALAAGFTPVSETVHAPSRARYMSQSRMLTILLTADQHSGRLLGCQVVGEDAVDKNIDIAASALWGKLTVGDLADMDLAYAPPFSPVLAPMQAAGELLSKRLGEGRRVAPANNPVQVPIR
jgi:NADPH-dependent 2,4-dienoyl-CoA reductase/sulfur reductase-like enzyme